MEESSEELWWSRLMALPSLSGYIELCLSWWRICLGSDPFLYSTLSAAPCSSQTIMQAAWAQNVKKDETWTRLSSFGWWFLVETLLAHLLRQAATVIDNRTSSLPTLVRLLDHRAKMKRQTIRVQPARIISGFFLFSFFRSWSPNNRVIYYLLSASYQYLWHRGAVG